MEQTKIEDRRKKNGNAVLYSVVGWGQDQMIACGDCAGCRGK